MQTVRGQFEGVGKFPTPLPELLKGGAKKSSRYLAKEVSNYFELREERAHTCSPWNLNCGYS